VDGQDGAEGAGRFGGGGIWSDGVEEVDVEDSSMGKVMNVSHIQYL
jgi:hypothetical protein